MGLTPDQFWDLTFREFALYSRGHEYRLARQWDMASTILALLANVNSGKGKRFTPSDFHPLLDVTSMAQSKVTTAEEREALFAKLKKF
jgi:hypothetical protein